MQFPHVRAEPCFRGQATDLRAELLGEKPLEGLHSARRRRLRPEALCADADVTCLEFAPSAVRWAEHLTDTGADASPPAVVLPPRLGR